MKKLLIILLSIASFTLFAKNAPLISQKDFVALQESNSPAIVLDVRSAKEFAEGHIKGAINISYDELADRLAEVSQFKTKKVVVYCRSGRRAGIAETLLEENGFKNLKHLDGDMKGWLKAGLPVEK